ncbi:MAG: class I SAM-dependent methyltransferase [Pirellulaceae bacterium]
MPLFDQQKWDAKYAAADEVSREPSAVLRSLDGLLPTSGRAIDVAGGAGRNAIWLAQRGLEVTIADVSPRGLELAATRARETGVNIDLLKTDLEDGPFPAGPWDLILNVCYLWRPLYAVYPRVLSPGGLLVIIQPTKKNLERHPKPPAGFLLNDGELPSLVNGFEIVHYQEGWQADGRHDAVVVARKSV